MEIFPSRPTASSLYFLRDGDSEPRRLCWTLFVVLIFPPFFGFSIYGLSSAVYFGYVVIGRYVLSIVAAVVRSFDVTTACNSTFRQPSTLSAVLLAFVYFVERSSTQGTVSSNGFLCWSFWEECELLGSCVHLPGWLMSQDFPEVESPAGFAALEGSARFQRPAHQGFNGFRCLSGLRDQHTEGADP